MNVEKLVLEYHNLGLKPFALKPDVKKPFFTSWQYYDLEKTINALRRTQNIGLIMGYGFVGLDLDRKGGIDGLEYLKTLPTYEPLPDTAQARTSNGGLHYLFRTARPLQSRVSLGKTYAKHETGIDIRGERFENNRPLRGYLAVEPTIIGSKSYKWILHPKEIIAEIPEWLALLIDQGPSYAKKSDNNWDEEKPIFISQDYRGELLFDQDADPNELADIIIERYPVEGLGERHMQLNRAIGSLIFRQYQKKVIEEAGQIWWSHFYKIGTTKDRPEPIDLNNYIGSHFKQKSNRKKLSQVDHQDNLSKLTIPEDKISSIINTITTNSSPLLPPTVHKVVKIPQKDVRVICSMLIIWSYLAREVKINPDRLKMTMDQVSVIYNRIAGKPIDKASLSKIMSKYITKGEKPASVFELAIRTVEGKNQPPTPSEFRLTGAIPFLDYVESPQPRSEPL